MMRSEAGPRGFLIRRLAVALLLGVIVFAAAPARATVVLALDLSELVWRSERVVFARVVSAKAAWDNAHERIETRVELQVDETWKGEASPNGRVVVVQPGGTVDGISMRIVGGERFNVGEQAVVFLSGPSSSCAVVGMAQGKRTVRRDESGVLTAEGGAGGATTVAPDAKGRLMQAAPDRARPLDELRSTVRAFVRSGL